MVESYKEFWTKSFVWNANAKRMQYWVPTIINAILIAILAMLTGIDLDTQSLTKLMQNMSVMGIITFAVALVIGIGELTLQARRLHDINLSGAFILLHFIPVIGSLILFILNLLPGKAETRWTVNQRAVA